MTYQLHIPQWHPATLNQLMSGHWSKGHRLKKRDKQIIAAYARKIPKATGKRRVKYIITLKPRQRSFDPDAIFKSGNDALTACGLLVNDSPKWIEIAPVEYRRGTTGAWGTDIELTDV